MENRVQKGVGFSSYSDFQSSIFNFQFGVSRAPAYSVLSAAIGSSCAA